MKAFLSHSSVDKDFVMEIYESLQPHTLWLDRAEIEWGNIFLEKIEEGIRSASDFILFWSKHSAESEWVRLEVNMAFLESINRRAIRFRIVQLDDTELPLYLQGFHYLSVATSVNPVDAVVSALREAFDQPTQGVRHRFLNRNSELGRIEDMISDRETRAIFLHGFQGIGKGALANEALRRFFEGASVVEISVTPGIGPVELALHLHHAAYGTVLPELSSLEALAAIETAMQRVVSQGKFMIFRNGHHWLDGEGDLEDPLLTIIRQAADLEETYRNPVFITVTRIPRIPADLYRHVSMIRVGDLSNDHTASLISLWYELSTGCMLDTSDASEVASQLHGHPVAAKIASGLIAQFGAAHLLDYPRELVTLRRDLAKTLIGDLSLSQNTSDLLQILAIVGVPVPSRLLVEILDTDEATFHNAVAEASGAGIAEATESGLLRLHPLVSDYFWRSHLDREDYRQNSLNAADALARYVSATPADSRMFILLLQAVFRLYATSGDLHKARSIRSDMIGELSNAAIMHYNRRQFDLAEAFIGEVLTAEPQNWRMRQYLARIRIRQRRWIDADELIDALLNERPRDIGIRHVRGWRLLREGRHEAALSVLTGILSERDHVASFRDAAECLYHMSRVPEALELLQRSKRVESDNPYTLDLEARIYEEAEEYDLALEAANVAVVRNPRAWGLRHRRARILRALGRNEEAADEASEAVRIDPEQFVSRSTLASLLLDVARNSDSTVHIERLRQLAINSTQRQIVVHLQARSLYLAGDLDRSRDLVERQIRRRVNLAPSFGLLVQIRLADHARLVNPASASAQLLLQQAKSALAGCEAQDSHNPNIVGELRSRILELEPQTDSP